MASTASLAPALHLSRIEALPSHWHLPEADIDRCISFSRVRCVFSLVSLLLLVTDIPRTGLGVQDVFQLFPNKVGPSVTAFFGPWAYPVAHIWRNESSALNSSISASASASASVTPTSSSLTPVVTFGGKKGNSAIQTTRVWSYEYDSTSIGLRGITELLNVSILPQPSHTTTATLELKNTWTNLDALVSAIQRRIVVQRRDGGDESGAVDPHYTRSGLLSIATSHRWIDRLHHYLYSFAHTTTRWRMHTVHAFTKTTTDATEALGICLPTRRHRPIFCDMPFEWRCTHPVTASLPKVSIWDHVDLRVAALQRKYPELVLDLTIVTTFNPSTSTVSVLSAYFESEVLEIVMLIRGRTCPSNTDPSDLSSTTPAPCSTVFIDDYRYERGVLVSNIAEWYPFTAALRAVAQFYVWVRLVLLFSVAYASEQLQASRLRRLAATLRTMSKIPFQVVVYGSLFPVLAYVMAHVIDCSFVDLYLETFWTTVNGSMHFDPIVFARHASVQMRNVWILALGMKLVVFVQTRVLSTWRPTNGVLGVRGLAISLSSMLSVFGPYRSLTFRNSSILSTIVLAASSYGAHTVEMITARPISLFNVSVEGLPKDMKMTLLAVIVVVTVALVLKALLTLLRPGYLGGILLGTSTIMPYSAGKLWSATALSVRFDASLTSARAAASSAAGVTTSVRGLSSRRIAPVAFDAIAPTKQSLAHARVPMSATSIASRWLDRAAQLALAVVFSWLGIDRAAERQFAAEHRRMHDVALRLEERSVEINSLVRLMNIAMMTDPWTLFRLRVLGRQVFFYEATERLVPTAARQQSADTTVLLQPVASAHSGARPPPRAKHVFVLPCSADQVLEWTGYGKDELRLVGHMSSRDLPWSALLQCG